MTNRFATASRHYQNAITLRNRIIDGSTNQPLALAWGAVVRECSLAQYAIRSGTDGSLTRFELNQLNLIDSVKWVAKAQLQTIVDRLAA